MLTPIGYLLIRRTQALLVTRSNIYERLSGQSQPRVACYSAEADEDEYCQQDNVTTEMSVLEYVHE